LITDSFRLECVDDDGLAFSPKAPEWPDSHLMDIGLPKSRQGGAHACLGGLLNRGANGAALELELDSTSESPK
jgi:hypothetical protein